MPIKSNKSDEEGDESYELIDLADRGWLKRAFGDITKASVAKQITVGGVSGWCAGFLFGKVGRAAAAAVGGSLLLMQVAHHQGLIQINWGKVEKSYKKASRTLQKDADKMVPYIAQEVTDFVRENMFLAGGFAGGFLLGVAS